ncbi:MAG: hypothetical protein ACRDSZ_13005 [Pseudonocardiaceae bacterium]
MLKALLRDHHLQNYGMFKRAYQKAARSLDKDLVGTYPSVSTFRRWLGGHIQDLPHAEHCAVLEAMLPGWTAADLFQPYVAPQDVADSTLLRELLRRRCLHTYRAFCQAYNAVAAAIDTSLVGTHPAEQQFHRWLGADLTGLPYPDHCNVLEAMFPGYSARQLFEMTDAAEPDTADDPPNAHRDAGCERSGDTGLLVPDAVSAWAAATSFPLGDDLAALITTKLGALAWAAGDPLVTAETRARAYHELVVSLRRWAHLMDRRYVLRLLGWAATAASVAGPLDLDEQQRIGWVLGGSGRVDAQTIEHFETILQHCKGQDDALGPRGVLDTVLIQRDLLHSLRPDCPASLQPQLLSVLSNASGSAGWFSFNLNDFTSAAYYYEDARILAHDAGNIELGAKALDFMSGLATSRGKPYVGIDHAAAAQQWAGRSGDMRLRALCADGAALAYAADGQRDACLAALDTAASACVSMGDQPEGYIRYRDHVHLSKRAKCHLELGDTDQAVDYAQRSLAIVDPAFPRHVALTSVDLARAYAQSREVDEAARLLGDAGEIAAHNSSTRLITRVQQARTELQPWQDTRAVRELDDRFTTYGLA